MKWLSYDERENQTEDQPRRVAEIRSADDVSPDLKHQILAQEIARLNDKLTQSYNERATLVGRLNKYEPNPLLMGVKELRTYGAIVAEIRADVGANGDMSQLFSQFYAAVNSLATTLGIPQANISVRVEEAQTLKEFASGNAPAYDAQPAGVQTRITPPQTRPPTNPPTRATYDFEKLKLDFGMGQNPKKEVITVNHAGDTGTSVWETANALLAERTKRMLK